MRFDAQKRIMSFSYERDASERIQVMEAATRRWRAKHKATQSEGAIWLWLIGYIVGLGLLMELYRRYVLIHIVDTSHIPPASIAFLQALPVFVVVWLVLDAHSRRNDRWMKRVYAARMAASSAAQLDIYPEGICATIDRAMFQLEWTSITDVVLSKQRIDFDADSWSFYIPTRAFDGPEDYARRGREIVALWKSAVETTAGDTEQTVGS